MEQILLKSIVVNPKKDDKPLQRDRVVAIFNIRHSNGETTLEQSLTLRYDEYGPGWVAEIAMDEFPAQETPTLAAKKLGEWLGRLGEALSTADIDAVKLTEIRVDF